MPRPRREYVLRPPPTSASTAQQKIDWYESEITRLQAILTRLADSNDNIQEAITYPHLHHGVQPSFDVDLAESKSRNTSFNNHHHEVTQLILRAYNEIRQYRLIDNAGLGGGGIYSAATSILHGGRREAPPAVRKILEQNPNAKITKLQAAVVPVSKPLTSFINWVSGGNYEKKRQELGYNDINHAYLIVSLDNGKTYRLEKNHVVEMYAYNVNNDKNQRIDLKLNGSPELSSFLSNAEKYQESKKEEHKRGNFWQYDPQNNNCQYFVDDIVQGNSEITNKEEANKFFFQPGSGDLIDTAGKWKTHLKYVVPLATIGDRLIHGNGVRPDEEDHRRNHPGTIAPLTPQDIQNMTRENNRLRQQLDQLRLLLERAERDPSRASRGDLLRRYYSEGIARTQAAINALEAQRNVHRGGSIGDRLIHGKGPTRQERVANGYVRPQNVPLTGEEIQGMTREINRLRQDIERLITFEDYYARNNVPGRALLQGEIIDAQRKLAALETMRNLHRGGAIRQPRCSHRYRPY